MSTTHSLRPITDFVDPVDIPIFDFLDSEIVDEILDQILIADAWTSLDDAGFTLGAEFNLGEVPALQLPGLDQVSLAFDKGGVARGTLTCGETSSLTLDELGLSLVFSKDILVDQVSGEGAGIRSDCAVQIDADGFHFLSFKTAKLEPCHIAGTGVILNLSGIELGSGGEEYLTVASGSVELPMFTDGNKSLILKGDHLSFGKYGPSGRFAKEGGPPLSVEVCGFSCELDEASVTLKNGQLQGANLRGRLDLSTLTSSDKDDAWISVAFSIDAAGLTARLSDIEDVLKLRIPEMFTLAVSSIRLDSTQGQEAIWLSGTLTPEIAGLEGDWPEFEFDEIGITSTGQVRLAEGAQIATTMPFTLSWNFATLTVSAFSLERPDGAPDEFKLRVSAGIELVKGLPAGASVDGLVAHWHDKTVDVTFNGIGITFGSPSAFSATIAASWDSVAHAFKGNGQLQIPSIDLEFAVIFESRWVAKGSYTAMFLAAETSLPGGIPIAATGLSLYGVSGILAHNYRIEVDARDAADPRRFYKAFMLAPEGFASLSKWEPASGEHALGLGVVIGTGDDGWAFSARGALMISFPDLSVIVTASANLLTKREPMIGGKEGKLTAVLAVLPAQKMLQLDFGFAWTEGALFQIKGEGGGEAHFDRPLALRVWAGLPPEQGSPITARLFRFSDEWLLNSQYWMVLDASRSVTAGVKASVDIHAGGDSIYAELVGSVDGAAGLTWEPYQFEGKLDIDARGRLAAGGLSLSRSLVTNVEAYIPSPSHLRIGLESCIDINLGFKTVPLCLHFTFGWGQLSPPILPAPKLGLSIFPRDWVPRPATLPDKPDKVVDDGTEIWFLTDDDKSVSLKTVQPHSVLALEFSKSMMLALRNPISSRSTTPPRRRCSRLVAAPKPRAAPDLRSAGRLHTLP